MDMNTSGMGALLISVYEKYGTVLFEGTIQLILSKIKPFA